MPKECTVPDDARDAVGWAPGDPSSTLSRVDPLQPKLPAPSRVLARNRAITAQYAQLYKAHPSLFKWAGMAAFASFHVGARLALWDWEASGAQASESGGDEARRFARDFQVIRIINNEIWARLGREHLAFVALDYSAFREWQAAEERHALVVEAFAELDAARRVEVREGPGTAPAELVWKANTQLLWHEQSRVVQPHFDRLSTLFSGAMSLVASFDYTINHRESGWLQNSRFATFMLLSGVWLRRRSWLLPDVTDLQQRWHWITKDLLPSWRKTERRGTRIDREIEFLLARTQGLGSSLAG